MSFSPCTEWETPSAVVKAVRGTGGEDDRVLVPLVECTKSAWHKIVGGMCYAAGRPWTLCC